MAYLGLSPEPDHSDDQYFTTPGFALSCGDYCATKKAGIYPMENLPGPEGCTCPDEVDAKNQGFYKPTPMTLPAPLPSPGTIQLTPQQIEAQVKQIQSAPAGGGLVLAAIAALLILGA